MTSVKLTPERKYAMTRVGTGDYLMPSNDGKTLWRFTRYTDGPSFGLDHWSRDRELWRILKWADPLDVGEYVDTSLDDWRWECFDDGYDKRGDAIEMVLRHG